MKADLEAPSRLVDVIHLAELAGGIADTPSGLVLGALTPLMGIERHPLIAQRCAGRSEAAALAASPQLRNRDVGYAVGDEFLRFVQAVDVVGPCRAPVTGPGSKSAWRPPAGCPARPSRWSPQPWRPPE